MVVVAGILHSKRDENVFLQERFVGFSRDMLENRPEKEISGVVVAVLRAGLELQVAATEFFHEIVDGVVAARKFSKQSRFRVVARLRDTGRMAEQLADGDFRTSVMAVGGEVVGEGAVEPNSAMTLGRKNPKSTRLNSTHGYIS